MLYRYILIPHLLCLILRIYEDIIKMPSYMLLPALHLHKLS